MADDVTSSQEDLDAAEKALHQACSEAQPAKTEETVNWVLYETIAHLATHALEIPTPLGILASTMLELSIEVPDSQEANKKAACDYWKERLPDLKEQRDLEAKVPFYRDEAQRKAIAAGQLLDKKRADIEKKFDDYNKLDKILHPYAYHTLTNPMTKVAVKQHVDQAVAEVTRRLPGYGR